MPVNLTSILRSMSLDYPRSSLHSTVEASFLKEEATKFSCSLVHNHHNLSIQVHQGETSGTFSYLPQGNVPVLTVSMTGRRQTRLSSRPEDPVIVTDSGLDLDIIDCIDKQRALGSDSDADSCCSLDSKASGPSYPWDQASLLQPAVHPDLCPGCEKLFRENKKTKRKKRGKTQPDSVPVTDPSDLSFDQWVLKKPWRPRRLPNIKGRLWAHVGRIRKRQQNQGNRKQIAASQPTCSRPHVYLQRVLRACFRRAVNAGRRRRRGKRKRRCHSSDGGARVAKQHRQDSDRQSDWCSEHPEQEDSGVLILDVIPMSVTMETPPSPVSDPKPEVRRKKSSFRDLLAQLICNRSVIVQEAQVTSK